MKTKFKIGNKVIYKPKNEKGIIEQIIDDVAYVNFKLDGKYKEQKRYVAECVMLRDLKLGWK